MLRRALIFSVCVLVVLGRPRQLAEKKVINPLFRERRDTPELSADCHDANGNPISGKPYEIPGDCDSFYQCSGGYRTQQDCAEGTVFNPALNVCDWPQNVPGCGPTDPPTTTPPPPPPFDDDCLDNSGNPISGNPFEKPGDCHSFYQCSNGYRTEQNCADGTVFNPALSVCDWPRNVPGCGATDAPTTTQAPPPPPPFDDDCVDNAGNPISGKPFEKPGDCNSFYQCSNGYRSEQDCAAGTVFNPALSVCDWPSNVPGCGATDAPTTTQAPATPPAFDDDCVDNAGNPISGKPFEKPGDCGSFYQCSNGYRSEQDCAAGTVFNPALSVCDWPSNVPGCGATDAPTTTQAPVTSPPFDDDCVDNAGNPISGKPFEKPGDCNSFYQCSNGYRTEQNCAAGTVFNPALSVCDWPRNVPGCGATDAPTTTQAPATPPPFDADCVDSAGNAISSEPFEKPGDCDSFYQCSNGYRSEQDCAEGTVFNPSLSVCDWPQNVPGCGQTTVSIVTGPPSSGFDADCVDSNGNPISGEPFESSGDCDSFYQCSNGYRTEQNCATGTVFNPALSVCDWPSNVPGCGATDAPTTTQAPVTPPAFDDDCVDNAGNPISGKPFEKPGDCESFYQCSNGYRTEQNCAAGTVFNPALSVCDWPSNVPGCGATDAPTTTQAPATPPAFDDDCVDNAGNPISGKPFEKPGDCNSFYQCSNGYRTEQNCAAGTVFNPALSVCDWPSNVPGCGATDAPTTTQAPATPPAFDDDCVDNAGNPISGKPFEKPGDCGSFYQCSNGYRSEQNCAAGTVFNPALSVCDWPSNVPGCGATDAPTTTQAPATPPAFDDDCVDNAGNPISGKPFEKPGDCNSFYQCSNGYRSEQNCAAGTVFNPALSVCDWPSNVPGCGATNAPTTTPPPPPPPFDDDCVDIDGNPISGKPFEKPGDCDHFYQCSNGYRYEQPCASGTVFNPAIGVCDWPYNVPNCADTTSPPPHCALEWSQWYNTHHPTNHLTSGDFEQISHIERTLGKICPKAGQKITDVRCKCAESGDDWTETSDIMTCNKEIGLTCRNSEQRSGYACLDYKVRFLCSGECDSSVDEPSCTGDNGEPQSTSPFEKPGDCDHFYQCGAGILYVMPCAPGTAFNPTKGVCDWPYNVPGC